MHIIAHRGGAEDNVSLENSLKAIKKSMELDIYAIELDLRWDGEAIVLSHDRLLDYSKCVTLEKVFKTVKGKKILILELKEKDVIKPLAELLSTYSDKVIVTSFEYKYLKMIKKLKPSIELGVLEKWSGARASRRAKHLKTKRIHMNQRWLWSGFIKSVTNGGYELYAYTVNSQKQAHRFKKANMSGVLTDYPSRMAGL